MSKTRASLKAVQLKHESTEEDEDDEDLLHQAKRSRRTMHTVSETGIGSGVPAFLAKLWRLVEDSDTNNLICWSKDGHSFIIQNQAQFARELLPLNYKHNNMASFIRQLNMYGFHKITSIENGGLRFDRDEIEFSHPCFKRNYPYLLDHIKRKISNTKAVDDKSMLKQETVSKVLSDVKAMRGRQDNLDSRFSVMKQENEALWREIALLRQKHAKQQQIVNKLIQFLISIVQPSRNMSGVKRHMQLMINDTPENARQRNVSESESESGGPVIHELSEELLEDMMNPNSPYARQGESISPLAMERPRSNLSIISAQNYDYSNQSADDVASANLFAAGGEGAVNASHSPTGQQVLYTVTEAPDSHAQEQQATMASPTSQFSSDEQQNVLTTPMVREQEARNRQLLKEKNKLRRRLADASASGAGSPVQVDFNMSPKTQRASGQIKEQAQLMPQPMLVKSEPDMASSTSGLPNLLDQSEAKNNDLYNVNFISNDMPTNIFEDDSLLSNTGMDEQAAKMDQQQQFGLSTVQSGKFADMPIVFDIGNDNGNSLLSDANLASTSKAAAAGKDIVDDQHQQQQQDQQQQQSQQPMTVAKYTGDNLHEEVHSHLDSMQDELDSLKDLLRGEGVSIDQNMLMGAVQAAPRGVAAGRMPTLQLADEDMLLKLFNESDVLDNYGLSFLNESMTGDKKASSGSELMAYQPNMYDLSDILDTDDTNNKTGQDANNPRQLQTQSSVLNTPRRES